MPRLSTEFKQAIEKIPVSDLKKLVIEMARKNRELYDLLKHKFVEKNTEEELFEETKENVIAEIRWRSDRGIIQKNLAKAISKAVKHINYFTRINKNKVLEAQLLLALLNEVFENFSDELGTCWTVYDSKLAITTNRLYNLVTKQLHEDYRIEYEEPLNRFLKILHTKCRGLDCVCRMPESL
jgi:hypothetical protein